ncbi:MAG: UvrD-helicase domain-containing protein [Candidatus Pacebacteria bacterium]|nr:UvrD-helicase domain-containing protein [Candidatus Paceibacterota bacterium]
MTGQTYNPNQAEAIATLDGPLLVLSGAGTGKTRVLTARLAEILRQHRAYPSQILAVTFTNKAATEMRHRVEAMVGEDARDLWLGTFHGIAAKILRRHAALMQLTANFTILDPDDQNRVMKQCLRELGIDEKLTKPRYFLGIIDRWKDSGYSPDQVPVGEKNNRLVEMAGKSSTVSHLDVYRLYQNRLRQIDACDFGDLLLMVVEIFKNNRTVLESYQNKFRYIMVDEFQDTNRIQYYFLRLLTEYNKNLCCVGDDDQSIYGWRGAEITNILNFEKDFPKAKTIRLEQNYRSTKHILGAASSLIAKNGRRLGKSLWTEFDTGEKVKIVTLEDNRAESAWVAEVIDTRQNEQKPLSEVAILVRTSSQTRGFEESLSYRAIPYRVYGGLRFYERQEIRDVIAYLRLIHHPADDLAFERIINLPKRGIGDTTFEALRARARAEESSMIEASRNLVGMTQSGAILSGDNHDSKDVKPAARRALLKFLQSYGLWQERMASDSPLEFLTFLLHDSGYQAMWEAELGIEKESRLENLRELERAMRDFTSIAEFLDHVALVMDTINDSSRQQVSIMTLHSSKGLEFDTVFLPGWEEQLFPHSNALHDGQDGLEEERRLAYVGLTRARKLAVVSWVKRRQVYDQFLDRFPSRFLREIPAEHCLMETIIDGEVFVTDSPRSEMNLGSQTVAGSGGTPSLVQSNKQSAIGSSLSMAVGDRVSHKMFGVGVIRVKDGSHLTVDFGGDFGVKKLIDAYVKKID